jgi:hypothetical protein
VTQRLLLLAACAALSACAASAPPPPSPIPTPAGDDVRRLPAVAIASSWEAFARLERQDSITLTLPTGARQTQVLGQRASFSVEVAGERVRIRLDSLTITPSGGPGEREAIGTEWTAAMRAGAIGRLAPSRRSPVVDDFTSMLQSLFPTLPAGGVRPGMTWVDTTAGRRQVQAFEAQDRRTSDWRAAPRTNRNGMPVQPVTATERFEQMGEANPGGQRMMMTSQGERSSTYYITVLGHLQEVVHRDSVAMLITIPDRRQTIPTMQRIRTIFRFTPPR